MEYGSGVGIAQRLAFEKQLLEEEKYLVETLKAVKMEIHALQIERMNIISMRENVIKMGRTATAPVSSKDQVVIAQSVQSAPSSLAEEFDIPNFDNVNSNNVELDLTVPTHQFYEPEKENFEEIDEMDHADDYEIEMSMLMNEMVES